ncbi:hypothetical protein Tco_1462533, partial [Tanacetum coccineum]
MVPRTVLTRSGPISLNTARPVNTVQPRTAVNNAGPMKNVSRVNTARPKEVRSAIKGNKKNVVKASAYPSQHMTGNRSYLTDYEEIDGGFVAFGADETITKEWEDRMDRAATTTSSLEAEQDNGSSPRCQDTILGDAEAQTRLKLKELIDLCTKLSDEILDLETTKTAHAKEIANLKKRVNKLEKRKRSRTPGMNLFKIGTSKRKSLGEEDASKQGRNLKHGKQSLIFEESDFDDEDFDADMD